MNRLNPESVSTVKLWSFDNFSRAGSGSLSPESEITAFQPSGSPALRELLAQAVLSKAKGDNEFFNKLKQKPDEILQGYALTPEEKEALSTGDIQWLESKLGSLDNPLATWSVLRLSSNKPEKILEAAGIKS